MNSATLLRRLIILLGFCLAPALAQAQGILVLGDSISAGYGLENPNEGWVGLLVKEIKTQGKRWEVVNASISGETTTGGLARVDALLAKHKPSIVLLELGANDGLRGLPPTLMQANLTEIVNRAKQAGAKTLLLGMKIPPNYGQKFNELFEAAFPELAKKLGLVYVPFLLEGVGGNPALMQNDGLHPNQAAQSVMMKLVWDKLQPIL